VPHWLLGALALASSQAFASPISVYNGMSPVDVYTADTPLTGDIDPSFYELSVTATGILIRLIDTVPDFDPVPSWKVTYEIWTDGMGGAGYSLGTLVDAFMIQDANTSSSSPSPWHLTSIALPGEYVLKMSTDGAKASNSQVSAVPLPAAALLFGSALLGLGALRRKQKAGEKSEIAVCLTLYFTHHKKGGALAPPFFYGR
jgi:hypothetical protein